MGIADWWRIKRDKMRSYAVSRRLQKHDAWSVEQLKAHQQERLDAIVRTAAAKSPFYGEQFAQIDLSQPVTLTDLPTLDRKTLFARYDEVPTDREIRRDDLLAHVQQLKSDERYLGRYVGFHTGGTTGSPTPFAWGSEAWQHYVGSWIRIINVAGNRPPLGATMASVSATDWCHATRRSMATLDLGLFRRVSLSPERPLEELVSELQKLQPFGLAGYPSLLSLLAQEQLAGRLKIAPQATMVGAEMLTGEMRQAMVEAWGVEPLNVYAGAESMYAGGSLAKGGLRLYEDTFLMEVVDADDNPVPDGEPGHHLLVTSLYNDAVPLIRYRVNDALIIGPPQEGEPWRRVLSLEGRTEDYLKLPTEDGHVQVNAWKLGFLYERLQGAGRFQAFHRPDGLHFHCLEHPDLNEDVMQRFVTAMEGELAELKVVGVPVFAKVVTELKRHEKTGKLRTINVELDP